MAVERIDIKQYGWLESGVVAEHLARYEFACEHLHGNDVLDVACGTGYGTAMLSKKARSVVGGDISEEALSLARSRNPESVYRLLDIGALDIPAESLDTVVSFETIEHVPASTVSLALKEFSRVLRPGGRLIISTPDRRSYSLGGQTGNPFHEIEYSLAEFSELLAPDFTIHSIAGQKFSYRFSVGFASALARLGIHGLVSKFWRGYKMVICRDAKVHSLASRAAAIPMVLIFIATKKS